MKIAVASDHRGLEVKSAILAQLADLGHEGINYGTDCADSCDYPDFASAVAADVSSGKIDRGILICGTGIGMSITAITSIVVAGSSSSTVAVSSTAVGLAVVRLRSGLAISRRF